MFGLIGYFKGEPNEHIFVYSGGNLRKQGQGITFFYWGPSTSIVAVPTGTIDVPFVLNETTGNFQSVTIQGQLTFRIVDPKIIAGILNFTIDPATRKHASEDPEKLAQRILNEIQTQARGELLNLSLEQALRGSVDLGNKVLESVKGSKVLASLGVEIIALYVISIKPTPEMAKALEAEYREGLQVKADQAIYNRRALAVEQERRIKENELATSVALEEKRKHLVELEGQNILQKAEYEAQSTERQLVPYKEISPQTILALSIKDLGENAGKIGNLTITSEILASLLQKK